MNHGFETAVAGEYPHHLSQKLLKQFVVINIGVLSLVAEKRGGVRNILRTLIRLSVNAVSK